VHGVFFGVLWSFDMPPIRLTREEVSSLTKLVERARPTSEIPGDHAAKFVNYGLARRDIMIMRATRLGQLELLRQRFTDISIPSRIAMNSDTNRNSLLFSSQD
jgi:hypothetical protein